MNNNQTDPRWRYILSVVPFQGERVFTGPLVLEQLRIKKTPKTKKQRFFVGCFFSYCNSFTDLSAAGLPAELKHITQRRKRKQP